jgi:hypothetical protein
MTDVNRFEERNDLRHSIQHRAFAVIQILTGRPGLTPEQRLELSMMARKQITRMDALIDQLIELSQAPVVQAAADAKEFEALMADVVIPADLEAMVNEVVDSEESMLAKAVEVDETETAE